VIIKKYLKLKKWMIREEATKKYKVLMSEKEFTINE